MLQLNPCGWIPIIIKVCFLCHCSISRKGQPLIISFSGNCNNLVFLEHVVVTMTLTITLDSSDYEYYTYSSNNNAVLEHAGPKRGDISIELLSPAGTKSVLLPRRIKDYVNEEGYESWPFMSVHHWGENPAGNWKVNISFASNGGHVTVDSISVNLYGASTVPKAISRIPSECSPECARNCSGEGPMNCDACKNFRMPDTLECVSNCSFVGNGSFCEVDGYCLTGEICSSVSDPNVLQGVYIAVIVLGSLAAISVVAVCVLCVYVIVKRHPVKEYLTLT